LTGVTSDALSSTLPLTGQRDAAVLRAIAAHRPTRLGVYGSTTAPGHVMIGDPVVLQP
jgi:uncharacterized protein